MGNLKGYGYLIKTKDGIIAINELDKKDYAQLNWRINNINQTEEHLNNFNWWVQEGRVFGKNIFELLQHRLRDIFCYMTFDLAGHDPEKFTFKKAIWPSDASSSDKTSLKKLLNETYGKRLKRCHEHAAEEGSNPEECDRAFERVRGKMIYALFYNLKKDGDI